MKNPSTKKYLLSPLLVLVFVLTLSACASVREEIVNPSGDTASTKQTESSKEAAKDADATSDKKEDADKTDSDSKTTTSTKSTTTSDSTTKTTSGSTSGSSATSTTNSSGSTSPSTSNTNSTGGSSDTAAIKESEQLNTDNQVIIGIENKDGIVVAPSNDQPNVIIFPDSGSTQPTNINDTAPLLDNTEYQLNGGAGVDTVVSPGLEPLVPSSN